MSLLEKSFILDVFLLPYFVIRLMETVTLACLTWNEIYRKKRVFGTAGNRRDQRLMVAHILFEMPHQKTVQDLKTSKYFYFDD